MYARYLRKDYPKHSSYRFLEKCSLFGCNAGFIPWLLDRNLPPYQDEPYKWHLSIQDAFWGAKYEDIDYTGSALIIDLKPQQEDQLSLYEVLDVWGYSNNNWSPILLYLSGLFVEADPREVDRNEFVIKDRDRDEPIYEFMYVSGSVSGGNLIGQWTAPPRSPTNAALLWPDSLSYFFESIKRRSPGLL